MDKVKSKADAKLIDANAPEDPAAPNPEPAAGIIPEVKAEGVAEALPETPRAPRWLTPGRRVRALPTFARMRRPSRNCSSKASIPYRTRMRRAAYEHREGRCLQVELLKAQRWIEDTGQKVIMLFEGRDAAGKGGTIKRFMEHLNPRMARVVALSKPTDRERSQWYFQALCRAPAVGRRNGAVRIAPGSNRAGVERVMGFCSPTEYLEFMREAPRDRAHAHPVRHTSVQILVFR